MIQYILYKNPTDYPGRYIVRRWHIGPNRLTPDNAPMANCATLEGARDAINRVDPNAACLQRCEDDDPTIVEVWL